MLNFALNLGSSNAQTIGVPAENVEELVRLRTKDLADLSESQKDTISLLKEKLDMDERQLRAAFGIVGEANVPPAQLATRLVEIAERYKALQTAPAAQPGDNARIKALKAEAQKAIGDMQFGKADEILAEIEKIQTEALDWLALNAAQTTAQRGDVALTRLRYLDAAQRFAEAAGLVAPFDTEQQWRFLLDQAVALYKQGDEFGDNAALTEAIDVYHRCIALAPRSERPLEWAGTQMNLGNALETLGERESGTARIEEAVAAYRDALQEYSRERVPLQWAMTTGNQGVALMLVAERRGDAEMAKLAVQQIEAAFRTLRDGGDAPSAAYYEAQLPKARALAEKLAKR